jgi:hypothetical protein
MTIVTSRWLPLPLPYARGQNAEPGLSELITQSAANLATHEGHIRGGATVGGVENSAPLNPSGDYGHDHSGGEFGRPFFRSICTATGGNGATYNNTQIVNGFPNYLTLDDEAGGVTTVGRNHDVYVAVPPCDPAKGAYRSLGLFVAVHLQVTALLSGDTLSLDVWVDNGDGPPAGVPNFVLTAADTVGVKTVSSGASTRITVRPGAINRLRIRPKVVRAAGGSARGARLVVNEAELGVYSV